MPREIISKEEIPLPMVKKILSKRSKDGELSFQQSITLEHSSTFSKFAPVESVKLVERLMKNYEITRSQAVQVINLAPTTEEELKTILDPRSVELTDEQYAEIVEIMASKT
ncbi:MAG: hypothetical protein GF411_07735 [Candidatus Lokiarchaeota archaeon]|nr:hypothetical protein [Candidatus Lokiarchaeota archaeon]